MLLPITFFLLLGCLVSWSLIQVVLEAGIGQKQAQTIQHHHTHTGVIPRIGGIGLVAALVVTYCLCFGLLDDQDNRTIIHFGVVFGGVCAFTLGVVDDFMPLGARLKLVGQILIAIIVHQFGISIDRVTIPFTGHLVELGFFLSMGATIVWIVAMMNLINLIDGLDGLAGGIGLMMMCLIAYLGFEAIVPFSMILALGMAGALLGFLFHNFPPAKVYMGDSGAYLLGYLIAALSLINSEKGTVLAAMIAPVLALALPIADVGFAILRRGLRGLPVFRPDRKHIHHRLMGSGLSSRNTVLILYGVSMFALMAGLFAFAEQGRYFPIFLGFAFVIVLLTFRGVRFMQSASRVRTMFTDSLSCRQDTRNALYLRDWLIVETERADSGESLWSDFRFVIKKMGFCKAILRIGEEERVFNVAEGEDCTCESCLTSSHQINGGHETELTVWAMKDNISVGQFELLGDLAAEAWTKTAEKWQALHGAPLGFDSKASEPKDYRASKSRALYRPTYTE